jgi:hypothetical protein
LSARVLKTQLALFGVKEARRGVAGGMACTVSTIKGSAPEVGTDDTGNTDEEVLSMQSRQGGLASKKRTVKPSHLVSCF